MKSGRAVAGAVIAAAVLLLVGCSEDVTYDPIPAPTIEDPTQSPVPSETPSATPTPTPSPSPRPIKLEPLRKTYKGKSCRYLLDLPKGAVLVGVRHSGPVYGTAGDEVWWRLVLSGRTVKLSDHIPAGAARDGKTKYSLTLHPNTAWANGDRGFYSLVQRSPHDRNRYGVWVCGA